MSNLLHIEGWKHEKNNFLIFYIIEKALETNGFILFDCYICGKLQKKWKSYTMTWYNDINIQILLPLIDFFNMIIN